MIGRAARNIGGEVIMYADGMTESMQAAIGETDRRRGIQERHNAEKGIDAAHDRQGDPRHQRPPAGRGRGERAIRRRGAARDLDGATKAQVEQLVARLEAEMRSAAASSSSSGRRRCATRSSRSGCGCWRRTPRSSWAGGGGGRTRRGGSGQPRGGGARAAVVPAAATRRPRARRSR